MTKLIGIIGCGSLGHFLAEEIAEDDSLRLTAAWNRTVEGVGMKGVSRIRPISALADLPAENLAVNLIIEVAHPSITVEYIEPILQKADYLIGSPTALTDEALLKRITDMCQKYGHSVYVPSGAFWGAHDIKKMADLGTLKSVEVVMKKHPASFKLEPPLKEINDVVQTDAVTLYEGPVAGICPLAPNNVNTMAAAALAAHNLGFNGTTAKLVADPSLIAHHVVEINVESTSGLRVSTQRVNPAKLGAVTGTATYNSFLASMKTAHGKPPGIHFC